MWRRSILDCPKGNNDLKNQFIKMEGHEMYGLMNSAKEPGKSFSPNFKIDCKVR